MGHDFFGFRISGDLANGPGRGMIRPLVVSDRAVAPSIGPARVRRGKDSDSRALVPPDDKCAVSPPMAGRRGVLGRRAACLKTREYGDFDQFRFRRARSPRNEG